MRDGLAPPRPLEHNRLAVKPAQAAIRRAEPSTRPADATLPLAGNAEQHSHDDAAEPANLLAAVQHPVDAAADAVAVFPGPEED